MMEQPNSEYINQLAGSNDEFKTKVIAILKRELPEEIEAYKSQILNKDFKLAANSVHKLKNKISIFGLEKGYKIAEEFEDNLKADSTKLQSDFEAILKKMQDFTDQL